MEMTYYTKETAPHEPVDELIDRYRHGLNCTTCRAHKESCGSLPVCRAVICAACHWDNPRVQDLRMRKGKAFRAALKRKLPPLQPAWAPRSKFPKGFDPSAVVIANPQGLRYAPWKPGDPSYVWDIHGGRWTK